jgi:hypothetical protein
MSNTSTYGRDQRRDANAYFRFLSGAWLMGPFFCVPAGFNVAVFAGVTTFTGCYFQVGTQAQATSNP